MKINDIHTDMELVREGLYNIDEYDYTSGMLLTEGYARTYSFRYPKGQGRDVHDENPTVIVLCTYRHANGNMHLAGININIMKDILGDAEALIDRAAKASEEDKKKMLTRGNYQLSRYEQMQRGLQDILSYDVESEEVDEETGEAVKTVKRKPRPCRSVEGAQGRYEQGKNSKNPMVKNLFTNYYRTYNMANIIGGNEAMLPGTISFTPKADATVKRKEAAKKRREEKKREELAKREQEAELARQLEPELEPTEPIEPEEPEDEPEPRIRPPEEEEYSEEFMRSLDGILTN